MVIKQKGRLIIKCNSHPPVCDPFPGKGDPFTLTVITPMALLVDSERQRPIGAEDMKSRLSLPGFTSTACTHRITFNSILSVHMPMHCIYAHVQDMCYSLANVIITTVKNYSV